MNKKLKRLNKILNNANAMAREYAHELDGKSTYRNIRVSALNAAKNGVKMPTPETNFQRIMNWL